MYIAIVSLQVPRQPDRDRFLGSRLLSKHSNTCSSSLCSQVTLNSRGWNVRFHNSNRDGIPIHRSQNLTDQIVHLLKCTGYQEKHILLAPTVRCVKENGLTKIQQVLLCRTPRKQTVLQLISRPFNTVNRPSFCNSVRYIR